MDFPEVTIAVLNYNGKKHIHRCLDSIFKMDYPRFKVIVIDNASSDGSLDSVKERYPQVEIIKYDRNHGFAKAYNIGLQKIEDEFMVLMNNDVTVEPEWLRRLMPYIVNNREVSAVTPKMLFVQDRKEINAAGGKCYIQGSAGTLELERQITVNTRRSRKSSMPIALQLLLARVHGKTSDRSMRSIFFTERT